LETMVKFGIEAATPHDLALFKCPAAKCGGFLVPYEVWRSEKASTVFATCYLCKRRYRFGLEAVKSDDWLPALRNFTWRCPFCGEPSLDVEKAVGNKVFRVQVCCGKCGKSATKKIEHRTYDVLLAGQQQKPEEVTTATDEKPANSIEKPQVPTSPPKKVYIVCPACDLEIEEAFKGFCPACGFIFSANVEERS
jgi:hypothetical protein